MKHRVRIISLILSIVLLVVLCSSPIEASGSSSARCYQDGPGVLTERTIDHITEYNLKLKANCSGAQIFVAVIGTTGGQTVTEYAEKYMSDRGVGNKEEDNGVLILLAVDDQNYTVLAGKAYKDEITTHVLTDILRNDIESHFADGNYDTAVKNAFDTLKSIVFAHYGFGPEGSGEGSSGGSGRPGGRTDSFFSRFDSCSPGDIIGGISCAGCIACSISELTDAFGGE